MWRDSGLNLLGAQCDSAFRIVASLPKVRLSFYQTVMLHSGAGKWRRIEVGDTLLYGVSVM